MRIEVIKADGTVEEYLHTKVMGTISNALGLIGRADITVAEELAEVVTYYLYHKNGTRSVGSSEVFSMVKVVLAATKYEEAAIALTEYHHHRKLRRSRTEVVSVNVSDLDDAQLCGAAEPHLRSCWDKSRIVDSVMAEYSIERQTARMIASMVEEKVLGIGVSPVPASLVRQLVLGDTAAVLRAQKQLQAV